MKSLIDLPRPNRDQALYDAIRAEGFARFPERKANYENYLADRRQLTPDFLPIMLDIENVSRCNYRCIMCLASEWGSNGRAADMSLAGFKQLLDQQSGLLEIKLQGMGEPLLNAETYFDMIRYARSRALWVRSTTNASLLHHQENYRQLIDVDICEIQVSLDGASAETYSRIRPRGDFALVKQNCLLLNNYARQVKRPRSRMWVVVQQTNFHELEQLPELAAQTGFERMTLSLDLNCFGQERWQEKNDKLNVQEQLSVDRALAIIEIGKRLGVEITFWVIDSKFSTDTPESLCPWPFERVFISSDMRVVPCCMISNPDSMEFGDARKLTTIWNGNDMEAFRAKHLAGEIPAICRSCYQLDNARGE